MERAPTGILTTDLRDIVASYRGPKPCGRSSSGLSGFVLKGFIPQETDPETWIQE